MQREDFYCNTLIWRVTDQWEEAVPYSHVLRLSQHPHVQCNYDNTSVQLFCTRMSGSQDNRMAWCYSSLVHSRNHRYHITQLMRHCTNSNGYYARAFERGRGRNFVIQCSAHGKIATPLGWLE